MYLPRYLKVHSDSPQSTREMQIGQFVQREIQNLISVQKRSGLPYPHRNPELVCMGLKSPVLRIVILALLQRTLTYFIRGSITVWLTSCLTDQDSAALLLLIQIDIYKFGRIQTSQTRGQPYSETSPYKVRESSLPCPLLIVQYFLGK